MMLMRVIQMCIPSGRDQLVDQLVCSLYMKKRIPGKLNALQLPLVLS